MQTFEDFLDPSYQNRAKKKVKELERIGEQYKSFYKAYQKEIDELNSAKVVAVKTITDIEVFINKIANKPKNLEGVVVTPEIGSIDYDSEVASIRKNNDKGVKRTKLIGLLLTAGALVSLPLAVLAIPVTHIVGEKGTAERKKTIRECDEKIEKINREIEKIKRISAETMTEREFLIVYSESLSKHKKRLEEWNVLDYIKMTDEQRENLGVLVNSTVTLIKRLKG